MDSTVDGQLASVVNPDPVESEKYFWGGPIRIRLFRKKRPL